MMTLETTESDISNENKRFFILASMVFFVVIGFIMLLFSVTFIKDLETLRNVPDALWNFICGKPNENEFTLPLLLTISILCFGISAVLQIWRIRLK